MATVELQLCLQFLDKRSKLRAARCSRRLLQAADHPFAWQGPSVAVSSFRQPQLGSLIRRSLLRHAPIALCLLTDSELAAAEVAAIPRLRELVIDSWGSIDFDPQLLSLPSLQGLQTLRLVCQLPLSTLRLLATLPALHTLECSEWDEDEPADWSWLPAIPALTNLDLAYTVGVSVPLPLLDAIGQCAQLQSLQLQYPTFPAGGFSRLCSTPAMRQLRHLDLVSPRAHGGRLTADEYRAAFSALARLKSLRLASVKGIVLLLPHLAHAPALRTLTISCEADRPEDAYSFGGTQPSCEVLRRLLTAASLLEVRLELAASIEEWRGSASYEEGEGDEAGPAEQQMDEQWDELQRMAAEMERVTIAHP